MKNDLAAWFEREGLMRYAVRGDDQGNVVEIVSGPLVWLGARDADFVLPPHPGEAGFPGNPLAEMTLDDFNTFMYRWLEVAVRQGTCRCVYCGRQLLDGDDLPDVDTWDAIFIEKELVAWMLVHFDCKKALPKKLKGMHPFELAPGTPPTLDLSHLADETRAADGHSEESLDS